MIKKIILVSFLTVGLMACDMVDDMKDLFEQQAVATDYVKEKYGIESQIGFNYTNGELAQVTLMINSKDVQDKPVSELEDIAYDAIEHAFKTKANIVYIQLYSEPGNM